MQRTQPHPCELIPNTLTILVWEQHLSYDSQLHTKDKELKKCYDMMASLISKSPILPLALGLSNLRYNDIKISNNPIMTSECPSEKKNCVSLTLKRSCEWWNLVRKACQNWGGLSGLYSKQPSCKSKWTFWNPNDIHIRRSHQPTADKDKVLVVCRNHLSTTAP